MRRYVRTSKTRYQDLSDRAGRYRDAISGRRYSVAECCNFALLQLDTAEQILRNEFCLQMKRDSCIKERPSEL
jgi:hypothetical protein